MDCKINYLGLSIISNLICFGFPKVRHISTDALFDWLNKNSEVKKPVILDTRTEKEYLVSHIFNAQQIPPNTINFEQLNELSLDTLIVTYCSIGYRSAVIASKLQQIGYTNVFNLKGSIFKWVYEGKPVYQNGKLVDKVHPYNRLWGCLLPNERKI